MVGIRPKLGRYRVQHAIGVGATGHVYRAEDLETHADVAVKALDTRLALELNQQIVDELTLVIDRLPPHPALAQLRAVGLDDDEVYVVSDFTAGESLDRVLQRAGPGAVADVMPRLRLLAQGLDHAAAHGICHGALHPRDIIVSNDSARITGVGLADILGNAGVRGSVRQPYTPPELVAGEWLSGASDQFSLAAIVFEWLFGEPIAASTPSGIEVPLVAGVDYDGLSNAFTKALADSPAGRFASCLAFVEAVSAAVGQPAVVPAEVDEGLSNVLELPVLAGGKGHSSADEVEHDSRLMMEAGGSDLPLLEDEAKAASAIPAWTAVVGGMSSRRTLGYGLALAAALAMGLAAGFQGGFVLGRHVTDPNASARTLDGESGASGGPIESASPMPTALAIEETKAPLAPSPPRDVRLAARGVATAGRRGVSGSLVIASRPSGASVTLNGIARGRTPLTIPTVPAGEHEIRLTLSKFQPLSTTAHVVAGQRARVAATLTPVEPRDD